LPTLFYYITVHQYGNPAGNIDAGGAWGSYIGLLMLGAAFVSIGVFTSSVSDNQVVSFVLAVVLCYLCFLGFDSLAEIETLKNLDFLFMNLSINTHYVSMSRGVIDTRDVVYFVGVISTFVISTKTVIESRKW
jgi:ABC-2 type transport system permease protein